MASAAPLREALAALSARHARLFTHASRGCGGVSLSAFLQLAGAAWPASRLKPTQLAHAFAESLPVLRLFSHEAGGRCLSPPAWQQALVRLAMLPIAS